MRQIEIINDNHQFHVFIGNTDFWLSPKELVELYLKLKHTKI